MSGDGTRPLSAADAVRAAREAIDGTGEPVVCVTVIDASAPGSASTESSASPGPASTESPGPASTKSSESAGSDVPLPGARMAVWAGRHAGTLGSRPLDDEVVRAAREMLAEGGRAATRIVEAGGVRAEVYLEPHRPPPELVIVGAGHIARPLCAVGALLGFRVSVLDDRPEFATRERFPEAARVLRADFSDPFRDVRLHAGTHLVLVTRGHKYDFEALRHVLALPEPPAYVGMVGSRRRTRAALEQLAREGMPPKRLAAVHAPVGLDVGAETPEEIAVSIAAELVLVRRGGTGTPLRDRERVYARWVARDGAGSGRDAKQGTGDAS